MRFPSVLPLIAGLTLVVACDGEGPSNLAPTAAFTVRCDQLDCSSSNGSADLDGTIAAYDWDFGDSSAHPTTREAAHRYVSPGLFLVTLTVTDDHGASATASKNVNVIGNIAPVAAFITSCTNLACQFNNLSFDRNPGTLTSFAWDFGDNSAIVTTRNAAHTYAAAAEFTVTLTVTDDGGATAKQTARVSAREPSLTATFTYSCEQLTCQFIEQSSRFDSIASYAWDFGDGSTSIEAYPSHIYAGAGDYTVRLTVTDDLGKTASASYHVIVFVPGMIADFSVTCSGSVCTFTDESTPIGGVAYWGWHFGDGETSTTQNPTHAYRVTGPTTFTVTLWISDPWLEDGDSVSHKFTVTP